MEDENDDICGLCGLPGADKIPHPVYWPEEQRPDPDRELVHAECEQRACAEGSAKCQGKERQAFLNNVGRW